MRTAEATKKNYVFESIRALIAAILFTLGMILLAAFLIKLLNVPTDCIPIINACIKCVSIFAAALICLRLPSAGYLRGIILGVSYILLAYVIFSLLNGEFCVGLSLLNDVALGAVAGLISGVVAVNLRK